MKAILTYNLPEERTEFFSALNGPIWETILYELDQYLRSQIKYYEKDKLQEIRDKIHESMNYWNLDWSE